MEPRFIPLSVPNFGGKEKEYVNEAVVSEWVSTGGSKVPQFEQAVADYVKMPRAVACNSGTSGLHLAMMMAGNWPRGRSDCSYAYLYCCGEPGALRRGRADFYRL